MPATNSDLWLQTSFSLPLYQNRLTTDTWAYPNDDTTDITHRQWVSDDTPSQTSVTWNHLDDPAYGLTLTVPRPSFTRDGYTFTGWNTQPDGNGVAFQPGEPFHVSEKGITITRDLGLRPRNDADLSTTATLGLFAQWEKNVSVRQEYKLTNRGEVPKQLSALLPQARTVTPGTTVTPTDPQKQEFILNDGLYQFIGWDTGSTTATTDITFTGLWEYTPKQFHDQVSDTPPSVEIRTKVSDNPPFVPGFHGQVSQNPPYQEEATNTTRKPHQTAENVQAADQDSKPTPLLAHTGSNIASILTLAFSLLMLAALTLSLKWRLTHK